MGSHFLNQRSSSLVEISISLFVASVLLIILCVVGFQVLSNSRVSKELKDLNSIGQACRQYYQQQGHWPVQVSDLQPLFISSSIDGHHFSLNSQANVIQVLSTTASITVVKPRGLTGRLDYR
jgi:hypothetical protein